MKTKVKNENELIAEFMGGVKEHPSKYQYYGEGWGDHVWTKLPGITVTPFLDYHKSWDWLMPVVEKISEYRLVSSQANEVCNCKVVVGKHILYEKVIQFIKWYNSQTPSNPEQS